MTATTKQKPKPKRDHIVDHLRQNPAATQGEIRDALAKLGIDKVGSSDVSEARRKLGLIAPTKTKQLTVDEVGRLIEALQLLTKFTSVK